MNMAIIAKRGFDIRDVKMLLNLHGALRPRGRTGGPAEGLRRPGLDQRRRFREVGVIVA